MNGKENTRSGLSSWDITGINIFLLKVAGLKNNAYLKKEYPNAFV